MIFSINIKSHSVNVITQCFTTTNRHLSVKLLKLLIFHKPQKRVIREMYTQSFNWSDWFDVKWSVLKFCFYFYRMEVSAVSDIWNLSYPVRIKKQILILIIITYHNLKAKYNFLLVNYKWIFFLFCFFFEKKNGLCALELTSSVII